MPACCTSQNCQCPNPVAGLCQPMPPPETSKYLHAGLAQSLEGSLLLSPGSQCAQGFVCALHESVSPVLWKFCSQTLLAFKVRFPGDCQSLCWIPRRGSLLWALKLSQQCKNFFGVIGLQFVAHPPCDSIVGLMVTSSKSMMYTTKKQYCLMNTDVMNCGIQTMRTEKTT